MRILGRGQVVLHANTAGEDLRAGKVEAELEAAHLDRSPAPGGDLRHGRRSGVGAGVAVGVAVGAGTAAGGVELPGTAG